MVLGVDIGGTKIAMGLVNRAGRVSRFAIYPTESKRGGKHVFANIKTAISVHLHRSITAIGVGIAGQVDHEHGIYRGGPNLPRDFKNVRLAELLTREFRRPVAIENDARCFTLAEATYGAGKKYSRVVGVTMGTGIGGGMVGFGALVHGRDNTAAEFGHMTVGSGGARCSCGKHGHLEAYASVTGMVRRYRQLVRYAIGAHELESRYLQGDRHARRVVEEGAHALAAGLTNILIAVNPDCIVLGGGLANFRAYTNLTLREVPRLVPFPHLARTPVLHSKLGQHAGVVGAALLTKT